MSVRSAIEMVLYPVTACLAILESFLFMLVGVYDVYVYSPLQSALWPLVALVPRSVRLGGQATVTVFTANIVSWARTLLVIPIAISLKYGYHWTGLCLVLLHDFLDHLDGIVAKVQREKLGQLDDPLLGGFMDAFCDKIVNVLCLWSILMVTDFSHSSTVQSAVYIAACTLVIGYEFTLGVVRVQDYYSAVSRRNQKSVDVDAGSAAPATATSAVMVGKLKEKLESMGIAALCVAQGSAVALDSMAGIIGVTSLIMSIRLAHLSLSSKLSARASHNGSTKTEAESDVIDEKNILYEKSDTSKISEKTVSRCCQTEMYLGVDSDNIARKDTIKDNKKARSFSESVTSLQAPPLAVSPLCPVLDPRASRVYTIGCFDLFHQGHATLLHKMRSFARKVIVGVHDSRSIYQLKKRVPVDSTVTRMSNVKQYADEVFCVAGTDPTPFIDNVFDRREPGEAIYIRGDDMQNFPARHLCESLMTVKFLPYTQGVSSTKLRKDLLNANLDIHPNDGYADLLFY